VDHSDIPGLVVPSELSPASASEPVFAFAAGEMQERLARMDRQAAEAPVARAADGAHAAAVAGFVARRVAIAGMEASAEEEEEPRRCLLRAATSEQAACIGVGQRPPVMLPGSTVHGLVHHASAWSERAAITKNA
jgi:hypothetical protein